jgi:alpha-L-glutamate ligase-like protein
MIFGCLKRQGILGINARIGQYMIRLNKRQQYPLVDNKIKTAMLAIESGVAVPEIYHIFDSYGGLKNLESLLKPYPTFVIKPAKGAMGHGIVVVAESQGGEFIKTSGKRLSLQDIRHHILQIMSGLYSLSGVPDAAILQYTVALHPEFKSIVSEGIPDIRVIVYRGYPVMAMTRLPTQESDGRANLHQGAIGAGIDMRSGKINHAIHHNKVISKHPDTGYTLTGHQIPYWLDILHIAAKSYDMTKMGYLGVDVVVDPVKGPLVLEMNARPGLSIQVANRIGLRRILDRFQGDADPDLISEERVVRALAILSKEN